MTEEGTEREILPITQEERETEEAENKNLVDALEGVAFDQDSVFRVAQLMGLEPGSEMQSLKLLIKSQSVQNTVMVRGHNELIEQLLCLTQGSWGQVLLLLTHGGAKVGRYMLAVHLASIHVGDDGLWSTLPTMALRRELLNHKKEEEDPSQFKWSVKYDRPNLTAEDLVRAAKLPLMKAVELLTGPMACPELSETCLEELTGAARTIHFPNNRGSISRWLYEYMSDLPDNPLQPFVKVRTSRNRSE